MGDKAESMIRDIDRTTERKTGFSFLHIFTLVSILASLALFVTGRKSEAIFVGLWAPTVQALKSVVEESRLEL